jgi:very-short-patch-repair endonuclease
MTTSDDLSDRRAQRRRARTVRSRELRAASTDAERRLWSLVRGRRLGGCKFRRQVPIDRYFADFACVEARLIVEADGGQHSENEREDEGRTAVLEAAGWRVIRFWNSEILQNLEGVARAILAEIELARR